jgi:hypothetical protein
MPDVLHLVRADKLTDDGCQRLGRHGHLPDSDPLSSAIRALHRSMYWKGILPLRLPNAGPGLIPFGRTARRKAAVAGSSVAVILGGYEVSPDRLRCSDLTRPSEPALPATVSSHVVPNARHLGRVRLHDLT